MYNIEKLVMDARSAAQLIFRNRSDISPSDIAEAVGAKGEAFQLDQNPELYNRAIEEIGGMYKMGEAVPGAEGGSALRELQDLMAAFYGIGTPPTVPIVPVPASRNAPAVPIIPENIRALAAKEKGPKENRKARTDGKEEYIGKHNKEIAPGVPIITPAIRDAAKVGREQDAYRLMNDRLDAIFELAPIAISREKRESAKPSTDMPTIDPSFIDSAAGQTAIASLLATLGIGIGGAGSKAIGEAETQEG